MFITGIEIGLGLIAAYFIARLVIALFWWVIVLALLAFAVAKGELDPPRWLLFLTLVIVPTLYIGYLAH